MKLQDNILFEVDLEDKLTLSRLLFLKNRYYFLVQQAKKYNKEELYLEYVANFIDANINFELFFYDFINVKYPELKDKKFIFNGDDGNKIIIQGDFNPNDKENT